MLGCCSRMRRPASSATPGLEPSRYSQAAHLVQHIQHITGEIEAQPPAPSAGCPGSWRSRLPRCRRGGPGRPGSGSSGTQILVCGEDEFRIGGDGIVEVGRTEQLGPGLPGPSRVRLSNWMSNILVFNGRFLQSVVVPWGQNSPVSSLFYHVRVEMSTLARLGKGIRREPHGSARRLAGISWLTDLGSGTIPTPLKALRSGAVRRGTFPLRRTRRVKIAWAASGGRRATGRRSSKL